MAKRKTSASKKGAKPSAKQLAARKKFAAAAKARSKKRSKSSAKRPVLGAEKKTTEGLFGMQFTKKRKLQPKKSGRKRPEGPDSRQDDVSKVTVRTPSQLLEPVSESKWEYVPSGYSRLGW